MSLLKFSAKEEKALAILQANLPDSATPFGDIAREVGLSEDEVLALVRRLKADGVIRRFGATLRHQKAGYGHNAMVAWYVEEGLDIEAVGRKMAERPEISHCYVRAACLDWPYNLYTMIHGKNPGDCLRLAEELSRETGVAQFDVLESIREMKKTSMIYFDREKGVTA